MTHENFDNGQTFPLKFHFKYLHKKFYIYIKKKKHYLLQSDIYTMDFSSGKTIYIYMCIWGVKEVEVEGRRNRSVKSSSELGKKSASESESEGRGQWCKKNLCFHALDTEHHTELLGTSPL